MTNTKLATEEKMVKSSQVNKHKVFEFAGAIFFVRIEGDLEKAMKSLTRLGITLPVEKEKVGKRRNQRVNLTIYFYGEEEGGESQINKRFRDWIVDTILPKAEKIQSAQMIKKRSNNFKDQEADTTVEISAPGNNNNVQIAKYNVKI